MTRCEDCPCCGHGDGGCPNQDGTFNCSNCGRKLTNPYSSLCGKCLDRMHKRLRDYDIDHDHSMDY